MARGTALPKCDWGLDYIGEDTPVDYARSALALGRLNVLYAFHLLIAGDKDGAVSAIKAGLRFSQDVCQWRIAFRHAGGKKPAGDSSAGDRVCPPHRKNCPPHSDRRCKKQSRS